MERVNRLVREEQRVAVKGTANKINDIFYYCRMDLETISRLPVLEDYHIARSFRLESEAEFNHDNIVKLFSDFISRTPYYFQIRYIDKHGQELIKVGREGLVKEMKNQEKQNFFIKARELAATDIYISDILESPVRGGFVIHCIKPIYSGWKEFAGVITIDLDYEKILNIVKVIQIGDRGYAFLVDQEGRNIAHPDFKPYYYNLGNYPDPSLKELVLEMMTGISGWKSYRFNGENKVAAFEPVKTMKWSLAVTIQSDELTKEANAIRNRVIQFVLIAIVFTIIGVSILSYYLLRPVRTLATATNRIANGDLSQEIPVHSRDELGDLTHSFNRMMKNLSRIHDELVRSEKLISLGRLSAGVAHEIRNPLNAMKGAVAYLQRKRSKDQLINEYTGVVSEEIDRLSQLVTEFLYFARQSKPDLVLTDLNELIASTLSLFEKEARTKNVKLNKLLSQEIPKILIDPKQIEQVLINLFINSMDAMPGGGELIVLTNVLKKDGLNSDPYMIQVTIEDIGEGIGSKNIKNIFDPFFSTKETGTGLGLPLSLGIIEAHGGSINVTSHLGSGTRVIIKLPINHEEKVIDEKKSA
jgi:signal transduction histidine kinase